MTPKSGSPGSLVAPAVPAQAQPADTAVPGALSAFTAEPITPPVFKPPPPAEAKELSWIEIELVGEDDKPIPGEPYQITLADGSVASGTLDEKGFVRVEGIEPGSCKVTFPELDQDAWEKL